MGQRTHSRLRLGLARALLVFVPTLLLFGIAEVALRIAGAPRLADDKNFKQAEFMRDCRAKTGLIDYRCSRDGFFEDEAAASVYVFGGSSVQGYPPGETTPFADIMQAMLDRRFRGEYVVHNLGIACRDSIYVRKCAQRARGDANDIYVIYAGHNDFANFMVANPRLRIFSEEHPELFEIQSSLARSHLYSALSLLVQGRPKGKYASWYRLPDPQWSESKRIALAEYQKNITQVIELAAELGIEVVMVTVVSNVMDYPHPIERWDSKITHRERPFAEQLQPWYREFTEGIEHWRARRREEALQAFKRARDLSLGGRAPSELNEWVRGLEAAYPHVRVVDFERTLDRIGVEEGLGCRFFGTDTWCDQFHPNPRTQRLIAVEVVKKLIEMRGAK